jgi:4-alpha-glucanotransferase
MHLTRSSGLLLHITSLPSPFGIGDLGPSAYQFAEYLAHTRQRVWQVLPLVPVAYGYSPYSSPSTFAGNPLLISPERLRDQGLLWHEDLHDQPAWPAHRVDFDRLVPFKLSLLETAYHRFVRGEGHVDHDDFDAFCAASAQWLDDYALFMALKHRHDEAGWTEWPEALAARRPEALAEARDELGARVHMHKFWQYLFARQWADLKAFCNERDIQIFGDLPIYVAHDSADVWASPGLFHLDGRGYPTVVAGVPPDYFSDTGQRWGNPIYRWDAMHDDGYQWWTRRLAATLRQVDLVRLDHFRGFEAYWEVPADEPTAVHGRWVPGPGAELFNALREHLGTLPVVAENLGIITPEVTALMRQFAFPGMVVLQFGFEVGAHSEHLPHNYTTDLIAYTGTHDNDTLRGWWTLNSGANPHAHAYARRYLGVNGAGDEGVSWAGVRAVSMSVANLVVFPLQDVLRIGTEGRMNTPGRAGDNWDWRFTFDQLTPEVTQWLKAVTEDYGRA